MQLHIKESALNEVIEQKLSKVLYVVVIFLQLLLMIYFSAREIITTCTVPVIEVVIFNVIYLMYRLIRFKELRDPFLIPKENRCFYILSFFILIVIELLMVLTAAAYSSHNKAFDLLLGVCGLEIITEIDDYFVEFMEEGVERKLLFGLIAFLFLILSFIISFMNYKNSLGRIGTDIWCDYQEYSCTFYPMFNMCTVSPLT